MRRSLALLLLVGCADDGDTPQPADAGVTAEPQGCAVVLEPAVITFPLTFVGHSSDVVVTLRNVGDAPCSPYAVAFGACDGDGTHEDCAASPVLERDLGPYSVVEEPPAILDLLPPGGTLTATLRYTPVGRLIPPPEGGPQAGQPAYLQVALRETSATGAVRDVVAPAPVDGRVPRNVVSHFVEELGRPSHAAVLPPRVAGCAESRRAVGLGGDPGYRVCDPVFEGACEGLSLAPAPGACEAGGVAPDALEWVWAGGASELPTPLACQVHLSVRWEDQEAPPVALRVLAPHPPAPQVVPLLATSARDVLMDGVPASLVGNVGLSSALLPETGDVRVVVVGLGAGSLNPSYEAFAGPADRAALGAALGEGQGGLIAFAGAALPMTAPDWAPSPCETWCPVGEAGYTCSSPVAPGCVPTLLGALRLDSAIDWVATGGSAVLSAEATRALEGLPSTVRARVRVHVLYGPSEGCEPANGAETPPAVAPPELAAIAAETGGIVASFCEPLDALAAALAEVPPPVTGFALPWPAESAEVRRGGVACAEGVSFTPGERYVTIAANSPCYPQPGDTDVSVAITPACGVAW